MLREYFLSQIVNHGPSCRDNISTRRLLVCGGDAGKGKKKKDGPRFLLLQNPLPRRKAEPAAKDAARQRMAKPAAKEARLLG